MTTATKPKTVSMSAVGIERSMIELYTEWRDVTRNVYAARYSDPQRFRDGLAANRMTYVDQLDALHRAVGDWGDVHAKKSVKRAEQIAYMLYRRHGLYRAAVMNVDPWQAHQHRNVYPPTVQEISGAHKSHRVAAD